MMIQRDQRQYSRSIRVVTFKEIVVDEISVETLIGEEEEKINCWMAREMDSSHVASEIKVMVNS